MDAVGTPYPSLSATPSPPGGRLCAPPGIEAGLIPPPAGPVEKVYKSILAALMNLRRHLPDSPDNPDNPEIPDSKYFHFHSNQAEELYFLFPAKQEKEGASRQPSECVSDISGRRNQPVMESALIRSWLTNPVSSSVSLPVSSVPVTVMGVS